MLREYLKKPLVRQVLVAVGPIIICGLLGNAEGYSSILLPKLQNDTDFSNLDDETTSWLAASFTIPMPFGCILGGYIMEKIGRRGLHLLTCIPYSIGWFLIALADSSSLIILGRLLTGLSDGLLGPVTGVFIAETSSPEIRGFLILASSVATTTGVFMVHIFGTFFSWRMTATVSGIVPIIFTLFMLFFPESPTYLAKIGKKEEAEKAFLWCRGESKQSKTELNEIFERQNQSVAESRGILENVKNLKKPELWKPLLIISVLFITAQWAGNNAFNFYCINILKEMKISEEYFDEFGAMLLLDSIKCVAALCSCFLINRVSRRVLALSSGYGVVVTLTLVIFFLLLNVSRYIPLIFLCIYVGILSMGLIPLSWIMMGEVFPQSYRGFGTGFTSFICYVALFSVVKTFPTMLTFFGNIVYVYATYAILTLIGTVFLTLFLPETKDKPLYVIEDLFKNIKK